MFLSQLTGGNFVVIHQHGKYISYRSMLEQQSFFGTEEHRAEIVARALLLARDSPIKRSIAAGLPHLCSD